ncbi:hypothetical protein PV08_09444 [Exophiala spinifera]|uniref:Uncharacterized protein n=1 Tax=Exophiala spinifera TaxID=91928 RepID=A0A0D2BLV7_9EURO|nr:uncharacterized protein PV08_09444 [Exophiala spinifera]KIW12169.1 hypothetical protein PV08_09444 [Exophiala spinifera]
MAAHPYGLRSRLNTQTPSLRATPTGSPVLAKTPSGINRKPRSTDITLQLQRVIGTTTNSPNGLACCAPTNTYAYCAGAVAVLARLEPDNTPSHRYFKARPTAHSLHPPTSHYDSSPATTPSKRRTTTFTPRKRQGDFAGGTLGRDWLDESGSQTWTARERIKSASCVALSQDGRWLAVGESGYNPRVLLFSTAEDASSETPTSVVSDHTYGVRCIAFSGDMKFLATLGNLNDGFLFVWSLNSRTGQVTLHSANKCTTNVCDMTWCGNSLITVGTRHIKIWQAKENPKQSPTRKPRFFRASDAYATSPGAAPGPAPLQGRNCLLGSMVDSTFTCVAAVDDCLAVVGTETGHLCLVDTSQTALELRVFKKTDFPISSIAYLAHTKRLLLGTSHGLQSEDFDLLMKSSIDSPSRMLRRKPPRLSSIRRSLGLVQQTAKSVTAVGTLPSHIITLDSDGSLQLQPCEPGDSNESQPTFAAHNSILLGVQTLSDGCAFGDFLTWSKNGEIKFWSSQGELIKQEIVDLDNSSADANDCENELTRVRYIQEINCFVVGDRFGLLKLIKVSEWKEAQVIRAHSAEITSITSHDPQSLIATCSRDRMVQLYRIARDSFELLQTMDDHVGSVNQVLFVQNGGKLLSCSADRSLVIRDRVLRDQDGVQTPVYLNTKVLTLKGSPLSMTISTDDLLLVSSMDRRVTQVEISTGTLNDSFKVGDGENEDTVFLNSMVSSASPEGADGSHRLLVGYCSMDKSIRVYNERNMALLGRESGHTEGVSDISLLRQKAPEASGTRQCTVVSTGLDGTIMIWRISRATLTLPLDSQERTPGLGISTDESDSELASKPTPAALPPLRKVLTKMDLAELTRDNGAPSPSTPRSLSPVRLKRKTSRLALSTTMEDVEDTPTKSTDAPVPSKSPNPEQIDPRRSPSPPVRTTSRPRKQRSRIDLAKDVTTTAEKTGPVDRSHSPPPPPVPLSMPGTPKSRQKPNNGRLRRPPSVPELRSQSFAAASRRQSVSQTSDFGSMGMATEQATRMLKTYRKKLTLGSGRDKVDLDDLEDEVTALLKIIRERKATNQHPPLPPLKPDVSTGVDGPGPGRREQAKAATDGDVEQLAVLLERSNMADMSPSITLMKATRGQDISAEG